MRKKWQLITCTAMLLGGLSVHEASAQQSNQYLDRFTLLRNKIHDPKNGYFSPEGAPYHSVQTLMAEAPDHGHETTSEAYSYWVWLEAMYGRLSGDWNPLNQAWSTLEKQIIPTHELQPSSGGYNPQAPATYAGEYQRVEDYPSQLRPDVPVGKDPISGELRSTYNTTDVYGMHWLLDCDNFYGFGNKADGVSKPSYINTFQRGEAESVFEAIPQPAWEAKKWGGPNGFLDLFTQESGSAAAQWKYTNAPDADARAVQALYWASEWAKAQGKNPEGLIPVDKARKMGDYLRLAMFDKYFKPIGTQNLFGAGGNGYESAHYLMSWYYAWGGPADVSQNWGWRIGSSHNHFGYQNPLAAYALSSYPNLKPASPNGARDWGTSMTRQMEFYRWLQSSEGAIAGGATNSWNGRYDAYPAGTATFYGMAYQTNPVYTDPGSNSWFGFQAWSMERVAELYYVSNNALAKQVLDKWVAWVKTVVKLNADGTYAIPSTISWSGQPDNWNAGSPGANGGLHVTVVNYGTDAGIAAALAKTLTYYAAATKRYATLDDASRKLAQELLDRMWTKYWDANGKGISIVENRGDYKRIFEQEVYVPAGWQGTMPNGDVIKQGVKFIDIRSKYKQDPQWNDLVTAYQSGKEFQTVYHRFWAQADIALANAEYGFFFGGNTPLPPRLPFPGPGAASIPGVVEAENFDSGGEGMTFHDTTPTNLIGPFRSNTAVDTEPCSEGGNNLAFSDNGEWLGYSVNVATTGAYTFDARVSSPVGGSFHIEFDGANVTGALAVPVTGGWQNWQNVSKTVNLTAGLHIMRFVIDAKEFNTNKFTFTAQIVNPTQTPFPGPTAAAIPGTVEAENFDNGGEGIAYHDTEEANQGGVGSRPGPDVFPVSEGTNGIGWINTSEWLEYTVNAATAGNYTVNARVASVFATGVFHLEWDGVNISNAMAVPNTGDWQAWQSVTKTVTLTAGQHVLRVFADAGNFNINKITFAPVVTAGDGLTAQYFNGQNFNTSVLTRKDANINFNWGDASPAAGVGVDNYSVRWTGQLLPRNTGTYTFHITSDNGRRVWVNNVLIIDKWVDDWGIEYTGTIGLTAGQKVNIKVEYFENWGGADAKLEWSGAGQTREVIPQSQLFSTSAARLASQEIIRENLIPSPVLHVSPNPASDLVNLAWDNTGEQAVNIIIVDMKGAVVYSSAATTDNFLQLQTGHFQSGIYAVHLSGNRISAIKKLLINR
ncbi:MAG: glycoside hydrolase family 48 protein [Bacteroidota bacterium]